VVQSFALLMVGGKLSARSTDSDNTPSFTAQFFFHPWPLTTMSDLAVYQDASIVATYMKAKFPSVLHSVINMAYPDVNIQYPDSWPLEFAVEVDQALDVLARAFHNQGFCVFFHQKACNWPQLVSTTWDVRRYADHIGLRHPGTSNEFEDVMQRQFKPLKTSHHLEITPCTITDRHGSLLVWYLPNILQPERQVQWVLGFVIDTLMGK
jgi:hypothetical protein